MNMVLCLFPNTRGVGYSFVEVPNKLMEYGMITTNPLKNEPLLLRATKMIELFKPSTILLRASLSDKPSNARVNELITRIKNLVIEKGIPIESYNREQIRDTFEIWGISTKHEIAQRIAQWFPQLTDYAPEIRKPYNPEAHYMGIFDSLALLGVYVHLM